MFSVNPAYDMEAADTDIYDLMEFKTWKISASSLIKHDRSSILPVKPKA